MAEQNDAVEEETVEGEGNKGNSRKLIIFGVIALLLVAGAIGGTLFVLGVFDSGEGELVDEEAVEVTPPALYFAINPKFRANYDVKGRQRLFQMAISLVTRDQEVVDALGKHVPAIKSKLVIMLSGQDFEALQTPEGREALRAECLQAVQSIMKKEIGRVGVEQVLFTDFVMQ